MTGHPHQGSGGPISCRPEGRLGDPLPAYDSRLNSALKNEDDTRTSLQDGCECQVYVKYAMRAFQNEY